MAATRVVMHNAGSQALLHDPGVAAFLLDLAETKAAANRSTAPRVSGDYADSITAWVEVHPTRTVAKFGPQVFYGLRVAANTLHL